MSRHEGVSCDSCMKNGFTGRRYKCLRCCDYDLCSACYEAGLVTSQHQVDHAMQCLLTRSDIELYFGGEEPSATFMHHSLTCPYCGQFGLNEAGLVEHVDEEHVDDTKEVVCPVCAATGVDPNHMTEDLLSHLTMEHKTPKSAAFDDGHGDGVHILQRAIGQNMLAAERHSAVLTSSRQNASRSQLRRADVFVSDSSSSAGAGREFEPIDPVSELLSQLTNARNRAQAVRNVSAQLHQLELQLQSTRQQLEGLPMRGGMPATTSTLRSLSSGAHKLVILSNSHSGTAPAVALFGGSDDCSSMDGNTRANAELKRFLLSRHREVYPSDDRDEERESIRADRSLFVQELLLAAISYSSIQRSSSNLVDSISHDPHHVDSVLESPISITGVTETGLSVPRVTPENSRGRKLEDGTEGVDLNSPRMGFSDATSCTRRSPETEEETLTRLIANKAVWEMLK